MSASALLINTSAAQPYPPRSGPASALNTPVSIKFSEKPLKQVSAVAVEAVAEKITPCWDKGKQIFLKDLLPASSNKQPKQEDVTRFLQNHHRLDKVIATCEGVKNLAEKQYTKSPSSRFVSKLLTVLMTVKEVGDPLLQYAPESISIAWSAVSILISIGANDVENCGVISDACTSIVGIVLNCRLYERRYQDFINTEAGNDIEKEILGLLPGVLAQVLDFSWHVQYRLSESKLVRTFKESFNPKLQTKYEELMGEYKKLRKYSHDAFQERVMDMVEGLQKENKELQSLLFPALEDLNVKLGELTTEIKKTMAESKVREMFQTRRAKLKPTDMHERQYNIILRPLSHQTDHLCQWLFENDHYKAWEKNRFRRTRVAHIDTAVPVSLGDIDKGYKNIFYIKGPPGFGKSVTIACVLKRLFQSQSDSTIVYFFFRKGDDASQITIRCLSSIAAQLFSEEVAVDVPGMSKFIELAEKIDPSDKTSEESRPKGEKIVTYTNDHLKQLIEAIGRQIDSTIYLVIDGIDECADHDTEELVPKLIEIARSDHGRFKLIFSSRDNMGLETCFANKGVFPNSEATGHDPFQCQLFGDATVLTVSKTTNSKDMEGYLRSSLNKLMARRIVNYHKSGRVEADICRMVASIKNKANGMFTYSAMVVSSLEQPSPLSLEQRLRRLPKGMDELYQKRLESLTQDNRHLILLALKWTVFTFGPVGTVEIAEEFKGLYKEKDVDWDDDDGDNASEIKLEYDGSVNGSIITDREGKCSEVVTEVEGERHRARMEKKVEEEKDISTPAVYTASVRDLRPRLQRTHSSAIRDPIARALRDPEIADTIYHLGNSGREFFKFTNGKRNIEVIHKSVRDWVENETKKASEWDKNVGSISSLFSWDNRGQLRLSMPIPSVLVKGQISSLDFLAEKDVQLDFLIYLFEVITHPSFHEKYMPFYPVTITKQNDLDTEGDSDSESSVQGESNAVIVENPDTRYQDDQEEVVGLKPESQAAIANEAADSTSTTAQGENTLIIELKSPTETDEGPGTVKESGKCDFEPRGEIGDGSNQEPSHESLNSNILSIITADFLHQSLESAENKSSPASFTQASAVSGESGQNLASDGTFTEDTEQICNLNVVNGSDETAVADAAGIIPELQERVSIRAAEELLSPIGPAEGSEPTNIDEDNKDTLETGGSTAPGRNQDGDEEQATSGDVIWRYEITQWHQHMKRVHQLWPEGSRYGDKWEILRKLVQKFVEPETFRRWVIAFWQFNWNYTLEEARLDLNDFGPLHIAAYWDLALLIDFLLEDEHYDVTQTNGRGLTPLHFTELYNSPKTVAIILRRGADVNAKSPDGDSPLRTCLMHASSLRLSSEGDPGTFKLVLGSIKALVDAGADINQASLGTSTRPIQYIVCFDDLELLEVFLRNENPKIDLNLMDDERRTVLHTIFYWFRSVSTWEIRDAMIKRLIEAGADVNAQDHESKAPLWYATLYQRQEAINILLENGADIHDEDNIGRTAIFALSFADDETKESKGIEILRILVAHGADITHKINSGASLLWDAVKGSLWALSNEIKSIMREKGEDPSAYLMARDLHGRTLLHEAAKAIDSVAILKYIAKDLTESQIKEILDYRDYDESSTALSLALQYLDVEYSNCLLDLGANPVFDPSEYSTTFEYAWGKWVDNLYPRANLHGVKKEYIEACERLLLRLIDANPRVGKTPYYFTYAMDRDNLKVAQALIKGGVDPTVKDHNGWDAADWAYAYGQQEFFQACFPGVNTVLLSRDAIFAKSFELPTAWGTTPPQCEGVGLTLSDDCLTFVLSDDILRTNDGPESIANTTARSFIPPNTEMFYFEITILEVKADNPQASTIGIGLTAGRAKVSQFPGWWSNCVETFGYHGNDAQLYSPRCWTVEKASLDAVGPGKGPWTYGLGDTVGCGFDQINHVVFFTLNGVRISTEFTDVRLRLTPTLASRVPCKIRTNFGGEPFVWKDYQR